MTEVQQSIFNLLVEIDEICKRHNITYYLIGGSALGAIRHQGFLPWDDDADIVLTKDNWEKLKTAFRTDLPPNRVCVGWDNYDEEPSVFFRYVDTSQTFMLYSLWDHKIPWGGIVDIFVLNPLPVNSHKWKKYHKTMRRFGEYIMDSFILVNNRVSVISYFKDCFVGKIRGKYAVKKKIYEKLSQYDETTCTHFSYLYARKHLVYPKEIFQEPRYVPFEGRTMPIPTLAEEHLRILFGDDWYNIPEDSSKIVHIAQHDTKRSYKEYTYDYLHYTKSDELRRRSLRAKHWKMIRAKIQSRYNRNLAHLRGRYLSRLFSCQFKLKQNMIEDMYRKKDFQSLYTFFRPYYSEQLFPIVYDNRVAIDVPERYLELALRALVAAGYNRNAKKIMKLQTRKAQRTAYWQEIAELLEKKNQAFIAYETCESSAKGLADGLFLQYPGDKDVRILKLCTELAGELDEAQLERLLSEAEQGEADWAEADEFRALKADILVRQGQQQQAVSLYERIAKTTRNGMVLLHISQKIIAGKSE